VGKGGSLFGTTFGGGSTVVAGKVVPVGAGTVFQLTPPTGTGPWTETILYNFLGGSDGASPQAGLISRNGVLFGTTCCGTEGTVFEVHEATGNKWVKTNLFSFAGYAVGAFPNTLVIDSKANLYGTTQAGGKGGAGIAYELSPPATKGKPWTLTTIWPFTGGTDGGSPYGALTIGPAGVLYGSTSIGGADGAGAVVQFTPPAVAGQPWTETVLYNFTGLGDGGQPSSSLLIGKGPVLYGTTVFGGGSGYGTVYEVTP
jgi:hypothetical protein